MDPSVDSIKLSALPTLKKFLIVDDGLELKINKRGMAPEGGGEVLFRCPNRKQLKPLVVSGFSKYHFIVCVTLSYIVMLIPVPRCWENQEDSGHSLCC